MKKRNVWFAAALARGIQATSNYFAKFLNCFTATSKMALREVSILLVLTLNLLRLRFT